MYNQKKLWDKLHYSGKVDHKKDKPTDFGIEVENIIPANSYILELGCGVGNDANYFTKKGHKVLAADFSKVAIENDRQNFELANLKFEVLDISKPLPYQDQTFNVACARLSLHYFTDKITREIFKEIQRVLKTGGFFCFICKSINDPKYGEGIEIEKNMFSKDDHIRHFFSEEYAKECLGNMFKIKLILSGQDNFYKEQSAFIKVIAIKI